jgi:ATP-binding cassette subfamily B protein RaxB
MNQSGEIHFGFRRRMPVYLQADVAECGLSCLAMIASYHGYQVDTAALRKRFPASARGTSMSRLLEIAHSMDLDGRAVRVEPEDLPRLSLPCILHWDMTHFVVLSEIRHGKPRIHDPSFGARRVSLDELRLHFTGVALELRPTHGFSAADERTPTSLKRVIGHVDGLPRALITLGIIAVSFELLTMVSPLLMQWIIDGVLGAGDRDLLKVVAVALGLLMVFQMVLSFAKGYATLYFRTSIKTQWSANIFSHLLKLPISYFESRTLGDIISRFGAVDSVERTLTSNTVD